MSADMSPTMPATATKTNGVTRKAAAGGARNKVPVVPIAPASPARGASNGSRPPAGGSGPTTPPVPARPAGGPAAPTTRRQGEGHGRRLTNAFEALEAFPALAESRNRLLAVVERDNVATADVVAAVESDVALSIAVLRLANQAQGSRGRVETIVAAVELLGVQTVQAFAARVRTFDFFERSSVWDAAPERFRLHALSTQHAADRLASEVGYEQRDRLTVTSLLHDVGKLVLLHAYPGYPAQVHRGARTPEERIHQERRELGVDHALVGGVLIRRWGLPGAVATAIERHHNPEVDGEVAFVRLADMLAHYEQGAAVSPGEMLQTARVLGLGADELRRVMYELPSTAGQRQRHVDPSPLSGRELGVLQRLAEGKVYKQIAHELTLSTSTVRTHLHNIYGKLGAVDRAQAVLIATERGWL
jgi:putative nucleotidyltransferase with HDIG domain